MAETDITITDMTMNEATSDVSDGSGTVATTPADGWNVQDIGKSHNLFFYLEGGAAESVFTFVAGNDPPAVRQGLGNLVVTVAAGESAFIHVDPSRFMRVDSSILVTVDETDAAISAFRLPFAGTAK